jgi:hypothetical protein
MAGRIKGQGSNWIKRAKRLAIYARDGHCCVFCGRGSETGVQLTLDHVLACELGGTNAASNLVTACFSCNSSKQDLVLADWVQVLADRGVDTETLGDRIRTQTAQPLDMAEGRRLEALRNAARAAV